VLKFKSGATYTRAEVKEQAGLSRKAKGGSWDTGILEHDGQFVIFANVGTEGRTGHDYGNQWEGERFRWYHKAGSHLKWPSVQKLLEPGRVAHVFWRESNRAAFEYAGIARAVKVSDVSPVEILWAFDART
jgi:Domain of unknown function (DUF3427).